MRNEGWIPNEEDREASLTEATDTIAENSAPDILTGVDEDGVVTVSVTTEAEVVSVELARAWRDTVTASELGHRVLSATNAATTRALAEQIEAAGGQEPTKGTDSRTTDGARISPTRPLATVIARTGRSTRE
ncbi:YbaB/EbfC family nucleoid-associated protein [Actinopolyspora mortivallis]|uniref:YbaB/EbfC family DNA-binding protein n=1 Tax=Actinopolyspora mortivallis TaxID=33906 RepID=A0A2T0GUW2_ACTMO|nr:YbaB/EbfC family nucleoid-associated protein [Actinopolyspora mortivallis]PRW62891.1 hypothetical protein CEP50_13155 [Actinopolyspora mortivallis]